MSRIEDSLHGMFLEILTTIPVQPISADIEFVADGLLPLPRESSKAQQMSYMNDCEKLRILPFSFLELSYHYDDSQKSLLGPNNCPLFSSWSARQYKQMGKSYIQGGKFHRVNVKIGQKHVDEFEQFVNEKKDLDHLISEQYKIHKGAFTLTTTERVGGYAAGTYRDTSIAFFYGPSLSEIILNVGKGLQNPDLTQLNKWYSEFENRAKESSSRGLMVTRNGVSSI